ncbi:hypothetical protein OG239_00700 [Streptomyces sp. NBC_00868]|uniref:hypothetical protein n=1 Tax=Streptomyces sp. NBC_00868 TaxID=2903683 RepID=UPI0038651E08|nr:hypothetical protein OG239_00700 [Streptomyces sp. NBC_00868]
MTSWQDRKPVGDAHEQRAADVETRRVRRDGLHPGGDAFGEQEELLVQFRVGAVRQVEVGVEDASFVHGGHPGLPGLV